MCENEMWVWASDVADSLKPIQYRENCYTIAVEHDYDGDIQKGMAAVYDNQFILRRLAGQT